ncbi:hypothetical protein BAE44_0004801 [Dichanthelium oligosanthes]|uniref:Uncharacterized protein n=1 Tax=Dichanthelium oligosanthes TaxID=888268 RepID=A0A1E5WAB8_9POAL|nr:hypothetical protein BAE44_0004801 [Dichanthelium oligosanthes]
MGCGASTVDGAEPRRRGWARARVPGSSEASTTGLMGQPQQGQEAESSAGRRRGCKVAPEPKEQDVEAATGAALPSMPGSPSFRYYCQKKMALVDKIVADADNSDGSVRIKATSHQMSKRNELTATNAHESSQVSEPRDGTRWLRFRGLSTVAAAWYNLFSRHPSKPPPAAAAAARSHP